MQLSIIRVWRGMQQLNELTFHVLKNDAKSLDTERGRNILQL